jgi:hypothetical protein
MRQHSWLRHYATSLKFTGSIPDEIIGSLILDPSSRAMALGATQPLIEMNARDLPGNKRWLAREADNLTAICGPII